MLSEDNVQLAATIVMVIYGEGAGRDHGHRSDTGCIPLISRIAFDILRAARERHQTATGILPSIITEAMMLPNVKGRENEIGVDGLLIRDGICIPVAHANEVFILRMFYPCSWR
jgi:hypothetical protein